MSTLNCRPLIEQFPRAQPFSIDGGPEAVLLVHGYTGTPAEMKPIAQAISSQLGWATFAPLLPGHGTFVHEMNTRTYTDWIDTIAEKRREISKKFEKVHLVGLSMGSLLCLELLLREPDQFSSVSFLVPPIWLRTPVQRWSARLFRNKLAYRLLPVVHKVVQLHPDHVAYEHHPTQALGQLDRLGERARHLSEHKTPPALVVYTEMDELVAPKSAIFLHKKFTHPKSKLLRLEKSIHVISLGVEKNIFFEEQVRFLKDVSENN